MQKEAGLLFKLPQNTDNNVDLIGTLYDMKDQARKDQEHNYKTELLLKKREHKEELANLREQYAYLIQMQDDKLSVFVDDFTRLKLGYQLTLHQSRQELMAVYAMVRQQQLLISDVEEGKFSQGMHSHYVPPAQKPLMPSKESHRQLFEALSKKKVQESMSTHVYQDKAMKRQNEQRVLFDKILM